MLRLVRFLVAVTLAWGAFAFGAVYQWASVPLAIAAALTGIVSWTVATRGYAVSRPLRMAFATMAVAIGVQLWPLPLSILSRFTPATIDLLKQFRFDFATGLPEAVPISIFPSLTLHALQLFVALAILAVGLARLLSVTGTRWVATLLTVLGVCLALVGIVQKPLFTGKIYGFWVEQGGSPFGPFVNRNHFAGWMMMALPLTLALLCAAISTSAQRVRPTWRDRAIWLASESGTRLVLLAGAALLMGLALVLTMSKSGIMALTGAAVLIGIGVSLGMPAGLRRRIAGGALAILVVFALGWAGLERVTDRFEEAHWANLNDRVGAWADAASLARSFPVAGTGLNTYGTAMLFYQKHNLDEHYAQAHNDYLQLLAEGGLLLTAPALLLVVLLARETVMRFRETDRASTAWWIRFGSVAGITAVAFQEIGDFSLQIPGNAALFAVLIAVAIHRNPPGRKGRGQDPAY